MTLANRARQVADAAPLHQSAEVLRECADEIDRLRADLAALRAVVRELPEITHAGGCTTHVSSLRRKYGCDCGADAANAAIAAAKKMAGGE